MDSAESGLVDIVREFLVAQRLMKRLFGRNRSGDLRFEEIHDLVGDNEESVLFRLKERCHALFRHGESPSEVVMRREQLFDLAVGSLFHEAMKFRENLYQRQVYGPKMRALRSQVGGEADELFREFEKILAVASVRLDEALQETENLLAQTRHQFRRLLVDHRENALVTRYLVEHRDLAEETLEDGLDALLAELHGDASSGYVVAARSYLDSGYFREANRLISRALARDPKRRDLLRLSDYARGMEAYLRRDYAEAVKRLGAWIDAGPVPDQRDFVKLARSAVSRVGQLIEGDGSEGLIAAASTLADRLESLSGEGAAG